MSNDCCTVQLPELKYGKEGVMFQRFLCLAYGQPSKIKIKNFKITENKVVIEISTHLQ